MVVTRKNIVSLFVGGTLLSLLFNPISKILDIPHQSCMFTSILISGIMGIIAFFSELSRNIPTKYSRSNIYCIGTKRDLLLSSGLRSFRTSPFFFNHTLLEYTPNRRIEYSIPICDNFNINPNFIYLGISANLADNSFQSYLF